MTIQALYRPFALLSIISLIMASTITTAIVSADSNDADIPPGQLTRRGVSGIVAAVGSDNIVVETKFGNVTVDVDGGTIIKSKGDVIALEDIQVGDRAGVLLNKPPDAPKDDDDDSTDPDVTPPDTSDDTSTDPDVTPPDTSDDTSTDPDVTPPDTSDDTSTDPDVTPPDTSDDTSTDPDVTPPDTSDDTSTDPDVTPPDTSDDTSTDPDVTPPDTSDDTSTDPDVTPPDTSDDTGTDTDVEPEPKPLAPSFRQDVTALRITIVPSKATRKHECVVVTETGDGTTTVLDEDGVETELEGDEGTEGEDVCLITQTGRGGGKKVTGSTSSNTVDDRLARLAEKNAALSERLEQKKADQETKRAERLEKTVGNAPEDKKSKAQGAKDKNTNRGKPDSSDSGSSGSSGSGNSGSTGNGNSGGGSSGGDSGSSGNGNSGNSGGGNSGNSGNSGGGPPDDKGKPDNDKGKK